MRYAASALLLGAVLAACGGEGGEGDHPEPSSVQPRGELTPAVAAQLDSGTVAYRNDAFEEARRHYRRAAELAPDLASAWFGVMLAERALGNDSVADSIQARIDGAVEMGPHGGTGADTTTGTSGEETGGESHGS